MITVNEIRNEVNRIVDILKQVETVEDCCALRKYGYGENCVVVMFSDGIWLNLKDVLSTEEDTKNRKVEGVGVYDNETTSGISYIGLQYDDVFFDVFDAEFNEEYVMLTDCTLHTLEDEYIDAIFLEKDL